MTKLQKKSQIVLTDYIRATESISPDLPLSKRLAKLKPKAKKKSKRG
jgi:hypothetical protein